ncbi:response regulator transcription factor [Mariniflexile sp. HNIBRBA6329]|uniref:response regulator transcription factor n=1 Tax=Mariniflexile sp. HNIBRBA6329 TaxID=3373088 RepID=UPI0037458819
MGHNAVLIIEDDIHIVELITIHLKDLGCSIEVATEGKKGLDLAFNGQYDLIILDLMLPGLSGIEICRRIRKNNIYTPILMLTAKSEEIDKVIGLETGADDYLTKPFSIRELIARVKVIFRRKENNSYLNDTFAASSVICFADLQVDIDKRKVMIGESRIELSPMEFDLLVLLISNPGKSFNRKRLLKLVWGYDFEGYEHTVNSHINRLRGKIEKDVSNPQYILTTWGVGYRFNEEL